MLTDALTHRRFKAIRGYLALLCQDRITCFSMAVVMLYCLVALCVTFGLLGSAWATPLAIGRHQAPCWEAWAGTDFHGRDVLAKILKGCQTAMTIGFFVSTLATLIGLVLGSLAGYFGGWVDYLIIWCCTTLAALPELLFLLSFVFALGRSAVVVYIGLMLASTPRIIRLIRGEVIKQREQPYILAATALGVGDLRKLFVHLLPNISHMIILQFSLTFQMAIKSEVLLSFLGLGVAGGCSWGTMIADAREELMHGYWWEVTAATGAMFFIVLALNLLGEGLRDAMDQRQ